jgi:hypothetical protein
MRDGDLFDRTWALLERQGKCDGLGGMEYTHVREEWEQLGRPTQQLADFIVYRANLGADGKGRERLN